MKRSLLVTCLAIATLISTTGCSGPKKIQQRRSLTVLEESVTAYNDSIRWGHDEKAIDFVAPADREHFLAARALQVKDLRFTEIRVGKVALVESSTNEATVPITRTYYRNTELQERTETVIQRWFRKDSDWFVHMDGDRNPNK